ncbi:MAG TPA: rhomboid family intramembrane serine protease [Fluviicola sp.]|nr:rhomboid family intramembrane serine protease [Fluviicola sp.]
MQTQRSFTEELKYQYKVGGMHIRLIFINVVIFLLIGTATMIERLYQTPASEGTPVLDTLKDIFALRTDLSQLIYKPWGLVTSMFAHFDLIHCLVNMLMLYFAGRMFLQFFSGRRLLHTYVIAGIAGGLVEILADVAFPVMESSHGLIVGASGSIMGLFIALFVYRPGMQVSVFGVQVPFFIVPLFFLISDFINLGANDGTAHFAHLGGALIGWLSMVNLHSSSNIINFSETMGQRFLAFFSRLFKPRQRMRVERGGGRTVKTDEQYNMEAKERQQRIDAILDKISKSGYESLSKSEKEFLFSQSKK